MRKIYCLLAASAIVFSASAAERTISSTRHQTVRPIAELSHKTATKANDASAGVVLKNQPSKTQTATTRALGARKVGDASSIEGTWLFQLGDYYFEESLGGSYLYEFEATMDGNEVWFEDPTQYELPFVAVLDETTGKLSFDQYFLGQLEGYYVYQQPFVWDYDIIDQPITAQYNATAGTITFQPDNGISWPVCTSQSMSSVVGYAWAYDLEGATKAGSTGGDNGDDDWTDMGNATLIDGWLLPAFGMDQFEYAYEVPLQQNNDNKNLYRLVNPYKHGPAAEINTSSKTGYIVFDVTDPDHVIFNFADAGFSYPSAGITSFYCYNMLGMYVNYFGDDPADIIDLFGDELPYTTFKDGVVNLSYIDSDEYGREYDANFGYQADPYGGYTWTDDDENVVNMCAQIIFPKVAEDEEEGTGTMTTQVDMNAGQGDPDLLDPETFKVTASYDETTHELTINNFADLEPITFTIDLTTGEAVAENQIATVDDYDPDYVLTYYYSDLATGTPSVYATVEKYGSKQTKVIVENWGAGMDFPGFGYYYSSAFYNTELILNLTIPGLGAEAEVATLTLTNPQYTIVENEGEFAGFYVDCSVTVESTGLASDAEINVYYTVEGRTETYEATPGSNGTYTFQIGSLAYNAEYDVEIYAKSGMTVSDTVTLTVVTPDSSGISVIGNDAERVRYFNLQGVEVNNPQNGEILIRIEGSKTSKVLIKK